MRIVASKVHFCCYNWCFFCYFYYSGVSNTCAICQENIDDKNDTDIVRISSCCHLFHKKWFRENAYHNTNQGFVKCPLCRTEIEVKDI